MKLLQPDPPSCLVKESGALAFGDAAQAADVKCPRIVMTNAMRKRRRRRVNRYWSIGKILE
ncbi:hypothetical protein ACFONL_07395 [Camelimonas fluminis]|uniref:Uncharacterized protein n=1 Tax=Camelimonas fluminis TaxID=1576911 RepID=A0ABV7UFB5_9HYPH|nr:hypothetical protein [Camelimonas fluminis]